MHETRAHHDDVAAAQERVRRRVAQTLDLGVDRGVLLDEGVRLRDVRLGLVVVVVADEVLDGVVRHELAELVRQLRRQRLVVREHEGRALHLLDEPGRGRRLAGSGGAEQHDIRLTGIDAGGELGDRLRLVAGGLVFADDLERAYGTSGLHLSRVGGAADTRAMFARGGCRQPCRSISRRRRRTRRRRTADPSKPPPNSPPLNPAPSIPPPPTSPAPPLGVDSRGSPGIVRLNHPVGLIRQHQRSRAVHEVRRDRAREQELIRHQGHDAGVLQQRTRVDRVAWVIRLAGGGRDGRRRIRLERSPCARRGAPLRAGPERAKTVGSSDAAACSFSDMNGPEPLEHLTATLGRHILESLRVRALDHRCAGAC